MSKENQECPFCGNEPVEREGTRVICKTFECPLHLLSIPKDKWNKRTPDPTKAIEYHNYMTKGKNNSTS